MYYYYINTSFILFFLFFFFFNDTATTEIYTLSLHDALPTWRRAPRCTCTCRRTRCACWPERRTSRCPRKSPWSRPRRPRLAAPIGAEPSRCDIVAVITTSVSHRCGCARGQLGDAWGPGGGWSS